MAYTNMRTAYGETLRALGAENEKIVALEADLGKSTMSCLFQEAFPERCFEMGIAEANMTSTAAGLAATGRIAFTHSFAVFSAGRAYDQIRQTIGIGGLNVKICGSSAGLSDFSDGATHQSVEDMAIMRAIPGMTVLCPADANQTVKMVRQMAAHDGPCYLRVCRNDVPNVTAEDAPFAIGVPEVLRDGTDAVVFACGVMVKKALEAAGALEGRLSLRVVNLGTVKPIDERRVLEMCRGMRGVVTAEEHSVVGGLGSAVQAALGMSGLRVSRVGIRDEYGVSARNYEELLDAFGLTARAIMDAALAL